MFIVVISTSYFKEKMKIKLTSRILIENVVKLLCTFSFTMYLAPAMKCYSCFLPSRSLGYFALGSRAGALVRALAYHPYVPGSIPGPGVIIWIEFVVGSLPCSEGFSPGSLVFLPPQKPTFLNSNSIGNSRSTGLSVEELSCVTLVKQG